MAIKLNQSPGLSISDLDRRTFLKGSTASLLAAGTSSLLLPGISLAQSPRRAGKFILYIHCGSWDGLAAGFLQPRDAGVWQRGLFRRNQEGGSVNPNINEHHKVGSLVLNNYTKSLESIANHVCFAAGTPRTLSHEDGRYLQTTGGKMGEGHASWIAGGAQAFFQDSDGTSVINASEGPDAQLSSGTSNITVVGGRSIAEFRGNFRDSGNVPKGPHADRIWDVLYGLNAKPLISSAVSESVKSGSSNYVRNLVGGLTELDDNAPLMVDIRNSISRANVDAVIGTLDDAAGIRTQPYNEVLQKLQLAAAMASSGVARGMSISMESQDLHNGGSSVQTARSAAQLFAQLSVFWQWIKTNGLQDDVMVVMSHEFTRTPYNDTPGPTAQVTFKGAPVSVQSPGVDHHLAMGMIFINGKVPGSSRIGGIGDLFAPAGSKALTGIADASMPAFTSTQIVGSMLMRCFDKEFATARDVRRFWPTFTDPLSLIVG